MRNRIVVSSLALVGLALAFLHAQAPADEERAIHKATDAYSAAYNKGDAEAVAAHWAEDADYMDDSGKHYKGRHAIAGLFKKQFAETKGCKLKTRITSIRFLKSDVALEDGKAEVTAPDGSTQSSRYAAVWLKTDGKWLIGSVRELPGDNADLSTTARLEPLNWLVGDWVAGGKGISVQLSCRWAKNKTFLLLEYSVKGNEGVDLSVTQWIGWDPVNEHIRSWFFDSRGGFGEGQWSRKGNTWTINASGTVADGRQGVAENSIRFVDDNSFMYQTANRELDGQPFPDAEVKLTRKTKP